MSLKTERESNLKVRAMKSRGLKWPPRLGMFADNLEGYNKHAQLHQQNPISMLVPIFHIFVEPCETSHRTQLPGSSQ
jgi:hypothetical protein